MLKLNLRFKRVRVWSIVQTSVLMACLLMGLGGYPGEALARENKSAADYANEQRPDGGAIMGSVLDAFGVSNVKVEAGHDGQAYHFVSRPNQVSRIGNIDKIKHASFSIDLKIFKDGNAQPPQAGRSADNPDFTRGGVKFFGGFKASGTAYGGLSGIQGPYLLRIDGAVGFNLDVTDQVTEKHAQQVTEALSTIIAQGIAAGSGSAVVEKTETPTKSEPFASLTVDSGSVNVRHEGEESFRKIEAPAKFPLRLLDTVVTGQTGSGTVTWINDGVQLKLQKNSEVLFLLDQLEINRGGGWVRVTKRGTRFEIITRTALISVRGTEFYLEYNPSRRISYLQVYEGSVNFSDRKEKSGTILNTGQAMEADAGGNLVAVAPRVEPWGEETAGPTEKIWKKGGPQDGIDIMDRVLSYIIPGPEGSCNYDDMGTYHRYRCNYHDNVGIRNLPGVSRSHTNVDLIVYKDKPAPSPFESGKGKGPNLEQNGIKFYYATESFPAMTTINLIATRGKYMLRLNDTVDWRNPNPQNEDQRKSCISAFIQIAEAGLSESGVAADNRYATTGSTDTPRDDGQPGQGSAAATSTGLGGLLTGGAEKPQVTPFDGEWVQGDGFWFLKPQAWVDNRSGLPRELVRQVVEPSQNAFVEIYSAKGTNPGVQAIADGWEQNARKSGLVYVQTLTQSRNLTIDSGEGILREYSGSNNGTAIRAYVLYTYHKDRAYVVVGVYVEAAAARFKDLVYNSVTSLRFSQPVRTVASGTGEACSAILGTWKWFTGSTVVFQPDGVVGNSSTRWACVDPNRRLFTVTWPNRQWVDTLTLSPDGNRLEGKNQTGNRVWAERIIAAGPPPAVRSDGEGSGRIEQAGYQWVHGAAPEFWIKKPRSWVLENATTAESILLKINPPEERTGMALWISQIAPGTRPEDLALIWEEQKTTNLPNLARTLPRSRMQVFLSATPDARVLTREYQGTVNNQATRTYGVYAVRGQIGYVIFGVYPEGDSAREEVLRQSMLGFRLARPNESQIAGSGAVVEIPASPGLKTGMPTTTSPAAATRQTAGPVPVDGLVAFYRLAGNGQNDSGRGYHGTLKGAVPGSDRHGNQGQALVFNRPDAQITIDPQIPLGPRFTVAAWVKGKPSGQSDWARIVDTYRYKQRLGFSLFLQRGTGKIAFSLVDQAGKSQGVVSIKTISETWQHVAAVCDGRHIRLYLNGKLEAEKQMPSEVKHSARALTIGNGFDDFNNWPFKGSIDDVYLYNRALSSGEILALSAQ